MTEEEREVMKCLVDAYNKFAKLKSKHPSHNADFTKGIHECQDVLIHRIVQRDYPEEFPTYD